ncbi:MAG: hypothetical protein HC783_15570 [Rhodobacteraceae bacterium]|nr:hypothetical protein [Paracoccaceae bacterium]
MTCNVDLTGLLKGHLDEDERVLWQGAPLPGIRFLRVRAVMTLLGAGLLVWGLAILGSVADYTLREGPSLNAPIFLLFGITMVAGGLHYGLLQWRAAARAHLTTRYVLTNRCAYVIVGTRFDSVKSYLIRPDTAIELDPHEGHSDVWFHVRYKHAAKATETTSRVGFEGISDGERVFMLLRSIQTGIA